MSAPGAILDRPEAEIDRPEVVLLSKPTGMVLRSQSRAGRSEVVVRGIYTLKDQGMYHAGTGTIATGNGIRAGRGSFIRSHRGRN